MYVLSVIGSHDFIPAPVQSLVVVFQLKIEQNELGLDAICMLTIKLNKRVYYIHVCLKDETSISIKNANFHISGLHTNVQYYMYMYMQL